MTEQVKMKPSYISRKVSSMQRAASEMAAKHNTKVEEAKIMNEWKIEEDRKMYFSSTKNSLTKRREQAAEKQKLFNESFKLMVASAAYAAMPIEGKEPLKVNSPLSAQPSAFTKLVEAVDDYVNNDECIKRILADKYTRSKSLNFGTKGDQIPADLAAVTIAAAVSPIRPDNSSFNANVHITNFMDTLTKYGSQSEEDTLSPEEMLYESFIDALSENVEQKVILGLKKETDQADMSNFLSESYAPDDISSVGNRNLAKKIKPTVFKEVFKTVSFANKDSGFPQDLVMQEAIAQYTLLETLNAIGVLGKTNDEIIADLMKQRKIKN